MSSDGFIKVFTDSPLRSLDLSLPDSAVAFTGAQVLELAESKASSALQDVKFPENLKSAALARIGVDPDVTFKSKELGREQASKLLSDYVIAIADELKDDPLVVSVLDGGIIRLVLEDDDDYAMVAENVFTDLDKEDRGKLSKSEIRNALGHMGIEMGIPPISEFPLINDILRKHVTEGEEDLGQAQFAQVLLPVLQDLEAVLAKKPYVYIQNLKSNNGSKLKKLLADENQLQDAVDRIWGVAQAQKDKHCFEDIVRGFLEKNGNEVGVPPAEPDESIILLYSGIFGDYIRPTSVADLTKAKFAKGVREILEKFLEELEAKPVLQDPAGYDPSYGMGTVHLSD